MRSSLLAVVCLLFVTTSLFAQQDNVHLLLQSADGKTVKLIWFIKKWDKNITGFDIKRKDGLDNWVKLNSEPIVPEVSRKKKLSIVESDKGQEARLKAKLTEMIAGREMIEIAGTDYMQRLATDDKAVQDLAIMLAHDYDLALINGFGFIDHTITKKIRYQYGLFIQGTNTLLDTIAWRYGQTPDMNVVRNITSKAMLGKRGIHVTWNADLAKMKAADVAGFHIYKSGIRLNTIPIIALNNNDLSEFSWDDKTANSGEPVEYSVSAESIFGIEGIITSYKYDPADHPIDYKKSVITDVTSLGYYFKDGISVKWTFPKEQEPFIKGFYLEKDNMPVGFRQVTGLLGPSARSVVDTSASKADGYMRFRVVAVYNDRTTSAGLEKVYNYFPVRKPPMPQNLKARIATADGKTTISLTWNPIMSGDSITDYFRVYTLETMNGKMVPVTTEQLRKSSYTYTADQAVANSWRYSVAAIGRNGVESDMSDTVTATMQTAADAELPVSLLAKISADNKVLLLWDYAGVVTELRGFRLYAGSNVVASERDLTNSTRSFTTPALTPGASYIFTLSVVAADGKESKRSAPVSITIPKEETR